MKVLYKECAGLDVHKDSVVACVRLVRGGRIEREVRSFGTTTADLMRLADWLSEAKCTHAVMEATGVYWKPVWHILNGTCELVLVNAAHVKNVPGRKTDVNDATWLADLLAHGLVRSSFVPEAPIQDLRMLTRTRRQLVREKSRHTQRIQKTLEDANIKLASVLTDISGVSGRAMLRAIIEGEEDPERLASLAKGKLRSKRTALIEALRGRVTRNHRFLLGLHLDQLEALDRSIGTLEQEVGTLLEPFRDAVDRLKSIPGVQDLMAQVIVSEMGTDMSRFPTAGHLVSWAGLCPRNDESAGKRRSTRLRKGAPWLKSALVQAAWSASATRGTYLRAQYYRIRARRGPKKAVVAVAASILTAIYHMLRDGAEYRDLGSDHFDRLDKAKTANRLVRRLGELGYQVTLNLATT